MTLKEWFEATESNEKKRFSTDAYPSPGKGPQPSSSPSDYTEDFCELTAEEIVAEENKEAIRTCLMRAAGGALEAFRTIDLNGHWRITPAELNDGMYRLGVDWQEITGFAKFQDVFKLFDRNNNRHISLEELFPEAHQHLEAEQYYRKSTPEFWDHWCKRTSDKDRLRSPKWEPSSPDEELRTVIRLADRRQEIVNERRRMAATLRRLRNQGKSDARCRECVATHLPRGTGPKDRQSVRAFTEFQVKNCRRDYIDRTMTSVSNIQKSVDEMREQRRVLHGSRQKLWAVAMEPVVRARKEEEAKKSAVEGLHLGLHLLGSPASTERS